MMIVGQYFGNAQRSQREHRATVGQAVFLVRTRLVKRKRRRKIRGVLRQDLCKRIAEYVPDSRAGKGAASRPSSREPSQQLGQDFFGCDKPGVGMGSFPSDGSRVPRIFRIAERN